MKYNELMRILKAHGCYDSGKQQGGHPVWFSPITGSLFRLSNHGKTGSGYRNFEKHFKNGGDLIPTIY